MKNHIITIAVVMLLCIIGLTSIVIPYIAITCVFLLILSIGYMFLYSIIELRKEIWEDIKKSFK